MKMLKKSGIIILLSGIIILLNSCSKASETVGQAPPPPQVPVYTVVSSPATTYQEFPAALEGKNNVEIRSQVDGYLDKIYVEEGSFVRAGQPLFKIDSRTYGEQVNMAQANLQAANANIQKAKVEVDRLIPLVSSKVVSDVQLKTAKANYAVAVAAAEQAKASLGNARINAGFTTITAPVSGYIGRIPNKKGSLISRTDPNPLTTLSDVSEIYAYFSLSEMDFIAFKNKYTGATLEEKIKNMPMVDLVIADNSLYPEKGRMSIIDGQFDKSTGAISIRAVFPNANGTLRNGNTGKVRMPQLLSSALVIPQESIFEIQDKTYVYILGKDKKVTSKPITISGKTNSYYFVSEGLKAGDKIIYTGLGMLKDGAVVNPKALSSDSLLQAKPL
ncbi:efflux RND transporter periplasmic adaptor subunit [Elizabethkingia anophelis]|uniref:efflux RND transporter periplasmic adaptor subunit n=1 Tax=Elizabethkingia anophelis TaxID=1117645 RepID=UPI0009950A93|nr:efflux RND transporter periplasmic adaptor subunit [Elizabethkingia anophelis]AQW98111.1 efflux transporter periplasmic adaptor subunit [Elizabethkingia anophelis]AQX88675.1 efflux transporter periplasmic adaptor subunit [Elizabethkingia anophelis]ASV77975.1 efflux RND transporter periplasmic adaptor subunit [Elizabethkingia anophelis]EHM7983011.1 efflux RND transporter periplasmic adaptor subunit [Elizabethkingia anophelis]EHZ9533486.1 efflux RND transporter periplasmic adaptor subunit [El